LKRYLDFKAPRRSTVTMQVHRDLRRRIITGVLKPKSSISENEIAQHYGVSRTPAREVLGRLEEEGLVEIYPQYGSFIAPIMAEDVLDSQFVRESLECTALGKAIEQLDPAGRERLSGIMEHQRQAVDNDEAAFVMHDEEMHACFFALAGHERAWSVVANAKLQLDRLRHLSMRSAEKRHAVLAEHEAIVTAALARDAAGAVTALRQHLRGAFASLAAAQVRYPEFFAEIGGPRRPPTKVPLDRQKKLATELA
jgi:DNA-binding GntR family transcriptional regulator